MKNQNHHFQLHLLIDNTPFELFSNTLKLIIPV